MNQTSVGSIEGIPFTACTSGPDIIILASNFSRLQQITTKANIISIDCSTDVGKIAVSHDDTIIIYEPIPIQQLDPISNQQQQQQNQKQQQQHDRPFKFDTTKIDYKWVIAATIEAPSPISVLSFNLDGTRLLAAGHNLYLWSLVSSNDVSIKNQWHCNWNYKSANQINYLKFSPDGTLFCSASKHDRLVKIWFQRNKSFSFIYLAHPLPIIGFEWRRTSKYTNKNSVANVLLTSCEDNISRIWVQDLYDYAQLYGNVSLQTKHMTTQFHLAGVIESSNIFSQKGAISNNNNNNNNNNSNNISNNNTSSSTSTSFECKNRSSNNVEKQSQFIMHWVNNKEIHITRSIESYLHDTLLKILRLNQNSSTTSPLSPGESCSGSEIDTDTNEPDLDIGNNDDTITAESSKKLRHKLCSKVNKQRALAASGRRIGKIDDNNSQRSLLGPNQTVQQNFISNGRATPCSITDEFDRFVEQQLKKWQSTVDVVFSLNKSDGSIHLWQLKYLDGEDNGLFRHVQIEKLSTLEAALSHYDATTMSLNILAYSPSAYLNVKQAYLAIHNCSSGVTGRMNSTDQLFGNLDLPEILSIQTDTTSLTKQLSDGNNLENIEECLSACSIVDTEPEIFFVTQHLSGILGLWKMNYDAIVPKIQSIELVTRITGLPIDPAWLQDGILSVEYNEKLSALYTQWVANSASQCVIDSNNTMAINYQNQTSSRPISPTNYSQITDILYPLDFNAYQSHHLHGHQTTHLASVDEEKYGGLNENEAENQQQQQQHYNDIRDQMINDNLIFCNDQQQQQPNQNHSSCRDSFRVSEMAANINLLPQYHVKQLIELLAFGKLQRVKAILNNVVNCLLALESHHDKDVELTSHAPWSSHRSRTLSIVGQQQRPSSSINDSFDIDNPSSNIQQQVVEEVELDYIEVTSIKPLPLYNLLEADNEKAKKETEQVQSKVNKREEFSMQDFESFFPQRTQVDETLDEILGRTTLDTLQRQKSLKRKKDAVLDGSLTSFNPSKAKLLTRVLTHTHLPGLSNVDQMHLLAVADAVALFDASASDYEDMQEEDGGYGSHSDTGMGVVTTNIAIDSLDDRGLRFLTAMRQHVYLSRCLPIKQRAELQAQGIGNHNLVWAFHSETQDELVSLIPCVNRNKPKWIELREYGIGWWLKKIEVLRKLIEKVAQSAYQARQDPLDAALFYLAMKKKTLVCALLRRVNCDKRLLKLFEQDFNDPINRKKALKNAYALLGLHRFEHAAAFFILAGSIWDAVEVCINNLNDIQLAIVLIRLHDTDSNVPPNLKRLLFTEILGSKQPPAESNQANQNNSHQQQNRSDNNNFNFSPTRVNAHANSTLLERRSSIVGGLTNGHSGQHHQAVSSQYHYDSRRANADPFLRSMAFWKLSDYLSSVHTLLENDVGASTTTTTNCNNNLHNNKQENVISGSNSRRNSESLTSHNADSSLGSGHLSPVRTTTTTLNNNNQQAAAGANLKSQNSLTNASHFSISASVFNFYLFLKEQPLVIKHKQQLIEEAELRRRASPIEEEEVHSHRARSLSSGELTFDEQALTRAVRQSSTEFEVLNETICRQVDKYSDEAIARKERLLFFSTAYSYLKAGCPLLALEVLGKEDHLNISSAQRMKFIACLHILMNELNTVSTSSQQPNQNQQQQQQQHQNSNSKLAQDASSMISSSSFAAPNSAINASSISTDASQASPTPTNLSQQNQQQSQSQSQSNDLFQNEFHQWLTKNINAMQSICTYGGTLNAIMMLNNPNSNNNNNNNNSCSSSSRNNDDISINSIVGEIDKQTTTTTAETTRLGGTNAIQIQDDSNWVVHNEPLLRTMLTYCNLHSANENSLTTVRLELLSLLNECCT